MRVAFDATPVYRQVDGVGRYTANIINGLAKAKPKWTVYLIGFIDDKHKPSLVDDYPNVVRIYIPIPRKLYQGVFSRFVRIPVNWLTPKVDVFIGTNFTIFPRLTHIKTFVTIHDLVYYDIPDVVEARNLTYLKKNVPKAIKEATGVIATSSFTARRVHQLFGEKLPVFIISNAVDASYWKGIDIAQRNGSILAVGTVEPRKNLTTLLRAYARTPSEFRVAHPLVVIGKKGWGDSVISELADNPSSSVTFTGYLPDSELVKAYQSASLFVCPSKYEGFGLPLLEAMSAEVPVLASDIEPFHDIASNTATYFDPNDEQALSSLIVAAITHTPDLRQIEAASTIARQYSWEHSITQLINLIEQR